MSFFYISIDENEFEIWVPRYKQYLKSYELYAIILIIRGTNLFDFRPLLIRMR